MRLQSLDGVRALLAIWVVLGHLATPVGARIPLLGNPAVAVDIFMLLSGFLIAATYERLLDQHSVYRAACYFWIRRVMRIWPLYVFLLTMVWLFIEPLDASKVMSSQLFPLRDAAAPTQGYVPPTAASALWHYSMLFGLNPSQATSTPLPDWSLSLEFQFYALFPLIAVAIRRSPLLVSFVAAALAFVSPKLLGNYLEPGVLAHFKQPP